MFHLLLLAKDPMFTSGQITFGIVFFIVFVIIISFMYLKDKGMHRKNYKGVKWILLGFIGFILLLFIIKMTLKS